jgi:hypothetical protein
LNILLLYSRGSIGVRDVTDMQALVGLDLFLRDKSSNPPLFVLLNSVNPFSLWYLGVLTIGVSVVSKLGKLKAGIVVTAVWVLGVLIQVATTAVGTRFQSVFVE